MVLTGGIHFDVPASDYHADPAPLPSLSASIANVLVEQSAMHARHRHPRLNPDRIDDSHTDEKDDGAVLHALLLGAGDERIVAVDADDWRTKAAQEARKEARRVGNIAVLVRRLEKFDRIIDAFLSQLCEHQDAADMLSAGRPEATLIWKTRDIWCRARPDWLPDDPEAPVYDPKFTSTSASPSDWEKNVWQTYGLRAEFYLRGLEALRGVRPKAYRFPVIETRPPYGMCVFEACNDVSAWASEQCDIAELQWSTSLATGIWRGYPRRVVHSELPGWFLHRWEQQRTIEQVGRRPSIGDVERVAKIADRHGERFGGPLS
jgi:hypothetical protein